jgi:hypothetical protein
MFLDNETGYYDNETNFSNHDAQVEAKQRERDDRFEYEAEAMLANAWEGETEIDRATRLGAIPAGIEIPAGLKEVA